MNDSSSTDQHDSVPDGDDHQRKKMTKTTRLLGFVLVGAGLFVALAVPPMLTQRAAQDAGSAARNWGGGAASAPFRGVLEAEVRATGMRSAKEARKLGFVVVIAGVVVLALARNPKVMDFLAKQQTKR